MRADWFLDQTGIMKIIVPVSERLIPDVSSKLIERSFEYLMLDFQWITFFLPETSRKNKTGYSVFAIVE